jgi:hypothetical protein
MPSGTWLKDTNGASWRSWLGAGGASSVVVTGRSPAAVTPVSTVTGAFVELRPSTWSIASCGSPSAMAWKWTRARSPSPLIPVTRGPRSAASTTPGADGGYLIDCDSDSGSAAAPAAEPKKPEGHGSRDV